MIDDIHAKISRFLQANALSFPAGDPAIDKAGLVPYIGGRYYVMKPHAKHEGLAPPLFQFGKGTRMVRTSEWVDLKGPIAGINEYEPLVVTALREAIEELGIKLENIARLQEMGLYEFASASTGKTKRMFLFAAEMKSPDDFLPDSDVVDTTALRAWLTREEFRIQGREDHQSILDDIASKVGQ